MGIIKHDRWTESEVSSLPSGEQNYLERKSGALLDDKDFEKDIAKTISALANSGGGYLILGQADDCSFDGVPEMKGRTPIREWLEQKLPHLVTYPLQDLRVHRVEADNTTKIPSNRAVIVIEIGDSNLAPHQSGKDSLYYYRVGGHSIPAPHFYLETLRGRARFPGPRVVRAWFDTVINPLLLDLGSQHDLLRKRSWKFDRLTQSISGVRPLGDRRIAPYWVRENQDQLFEIYSDIATAFNNRGSAYTLFHERVVFFFRTIRESQALIHIFQICTTSDSLKAIRDMAKESYMQGLSDDDFLKRLCSGPVDVFLDRLAGHVVNMIPELEETHSDSLFWNTQGEKFLQMLRSSEAGYCESRVKEASEVLLNEGLTLIGLLTETRRQLSQQQGVPYIKLTGS